MFAMKRRVTNCMDTINWILNALHIKLTNFMIIMSDFNYTEYEYHMKFFFKSNLFLQIKLIDPTQYLLYINVRASINKVRPN